MRKINLILGLFLTHTIIYAQTIEETPHFNSDGSVKHAVSLNIGATVFSFNQYYENTGPTISILYQRQFLNKHFLRGGFRFQAPSQNNVGSPYSPYTVDASNSTDPGNYSRTNFLNTRDVTENFMVGYEIGYAKHFGKTKVQPVIGVSLYMGYQHIKGVFSEVSWSESKIYNPITQSSVYEVEPLTNGVAFHTNHRIFLGVIPRLGFNADISKRFSVGASLTPYVGFSHRVGLREGFKGDKPEIAGFDKSYWKGLANAELNFVFKIVPPFKRSK